MSTKSINTAANQMDLIFKVVTKINHCVQNLIDLRYSSTTE